jgi:hypothetical protein
VAYRYQSSLKQSAAMELLLAAHPTLLSLEEIRREVGDPIAADDALAYFLRLGLAHKIESPAGGYFWATRTATAAEEACTAPSIEGHALK